MVCIYVMFHNSFCLFETGFLCVTLTLLELIYVDLTGLKLRDLSASDFQMLGLKVCASPSWLCCAL